jgi:hypothetical protein
MATWSDLPPELIREIILHVLLNQEAVAYTGSSSESMFDCAKRLEEYSHCKIVSRSFITGLDAVHEISGRDFANKYHYKLFQTYNTSRIQLRDLLALSLTCRYLYQMIKSILYKTVEFNSHTAPKKHSLVRTRNFLCSILFQPSLATHVRNLALISSFGEGSYEEMHDNNKQLDWIERAANRIAKFALDGQPEADIRHYLDDGWVQWASLFLLLPNLQTLKINLESIPSFWEDYVHSCPGDFTVSIVPGLRNVREFSLIHDSVGDDLDPIALLPIFQLPNLRRLYFGGLLSSELEWGNHDPSNYIGKSSVTDLSFDFALVDLSVCTAFLQFPRMLQNFTYTYGSGLTSVFGPDGNELHKALQAQCSSLSKINIRHSRDIRDEAEDIIPLGSFQDFTSLEELEIPVTLLPSDDNGVYTLPLALVRLQLYVWDDLPMGILAEMLVDILDNKEEYTPKLKRIELDYWLSASDDDQETQEIGIKELVNMCSDAGVELEVSVDAVSRTS